MTQSISWAFQDAATARQANRRVAAAVDPGVYQGFFPVVSVSSVIPNRIDLTPGADGVSVVITAEGVRIEENTSLAAVAQFVNPDATRERYDLVVLEYQYTTDRNIPAIYKVVPGAFAPVGQTPVLPQPQNQYQVPICYVRIRPVAPAGGPTLVNLAQSDLLPVIRGQDVTHPRDMGALKPILDPSNSARQRLYVYPGTYPSTDRSTIVDFFGGYSRLITDTALVAAMTVGQTQYWAIGITDDGVVDLFEQLSSFTDNPTNVESALPLCVVEIRNISGDPGITQLRDIRQFVARLGTGSDELDQWKDMFASTVFEDLVFDALANLDRVYANSLTDTGATPDTSGLTLELDQAQSALVLKCDGVNVPSGDVTLVLGDFLAAAGFSSVREFVVAALHDVPGQGTAGLQFRYSFSGVFGGFQPDSSLAALPLDNNLDSPIIATPGNPTNLFLKLVFPVNLFPAGTAVEYRIFSIGVMANIDRAVASAETLLDDARTTLENAVRNVIANDFTHWSYPNDTAFVAPNDPASSAFSMLISGDSGDISAGKRQVGPDGWQAVWQTAGAIPSVSLTRYQRSTGTDRRFALRTQISSIAATNAGELLLEYRVPACLFRVGDAVSFAVNVEVNAPGIAGLSIRLYNRNAQNELKVVTEAPAVYAPAGFKRLVSTTGGNKIDASHTAVGFVLRLRQSASLAVDAKWSDPVGCAGEFSTVLPFSAPQDPLTELQHYVSVHRMMQKGHTSEPSPVGISAPMAPKYRSLGSPRAELVALSGAQNSSNVSGLTATPDDFGQSLAVEGVSIQNGPYAIDALVVADVLYEKES